MNVLTCQSRPGRSADRGRLTGWLVLVAGMAASGVLTNIEGQSACWARPINRVEKVILPPEEPPPAEPVVEPPAAPVAPTGRTPAARTGAAGGRAATTQSTPRQPRPPKPSPPGQLAPNPDAKFACDQMEVDLEPVWRGEKSLTFTFEIRNEGTAELQIRAQGG